MFKKIAIAVVVLLAAIFIYAAMQPDTFRVQRATTIKAPPEKIFAILNDFQKSVAWSPYEKKDPAMKRTFSGAPSGKGSVYAFEGNNEVGTGRLEIVESLPPKKVALQLDMVKPFMGSNIIEYTLEPKGEATEVTWAIHGPVPFISKLMCIFVNMDKMVGKDFETGLANLKTIAEK
jgi:carbon monoxide dehydrogenase subunit G